MGVIYKRITEIIVNLLMNRADNDSDLTMFPLHLPQFQRFNKYASRTGSFIPQQPLIGN